MSLAPHNTASRVAKAVDRCREMIVWYEKNKRISRLLYQTSQFLSVAFGGAHSYTHSMVGPPEANSSIAGCFGHDGCSAVWYLPLA